MEIDINLTKDSFLGAKIEVLQPKNGYRAGIDAVLLGSYAGYIKNNNIAELGMGVGTASLCAAFWQQKLHKDYQEIFGIEKDEVAFKLCVQNFSNNNINQAKIINADGLVSDKNHENKYDLVISNPPFFDDDKNIRNPSDQRTNAYIIGAPLLFWIKSMLRLCHAKGEIILIHRADRLYDILHALQNRAGDIKIIPISSVKNRAANRILIRARKNSKAPTLICPNLYLRDNEGDVGYTENIDKMCKGIENLNWDKFA